MPVPFQTIMTHFRPHPDELGAMWLLLLFGEKMFPGIENAKITYCPAGAKLPDGHSSEDYETAGILLIGVGGGRFDEHPTIDRDRVQGECAMTLVARALGVEEDPALAPILEFIRGNDLDGSGWGVDQFANLVDAFHFSNPDNPEVVISWAFMTLSALYQKQRHFTTTTKTEFELKATVEEIPVPHGMVRMATIESDDEMVARYARSKDGGDADVVIQRTSTGNVQIFTRRLTLGDIPQMIRLAEQKLRGDVQTTDWETLASEGTVPGAENWSLHGKRRMFLNGSLTAKGVLPTILPLELIQQIVRIGMDPMEFEPSRAAWCQAGECTSQASNPCPWYAYGLSRCRTIRFNQHNRR